MNHHIKKYLLVELFHSHVYLMETPNLLLSGYIITSDYILIVGYQFLLTTLIKLQPWKLQRLQ